MADDSAVATGSALFDACYRQHQGVQDAVMLCLTQGLEQQYADKASNTVQWLLVLAGALVFSMQLGFAMLCAGCVRRKNVGNTLLKNLLDACGAAIAWFVLGWAMAFGGENGEKGFTFAGNANFFLTGEVDYAVWFFQYAFSAASVTIIAGTLAERCKMSAYICYSVFMTGFVYPIVVHSIWSTNGFLSASATNPFNGVGVIDFAGSGVVHLTGGSTALVATYVLGSRKGRFVDSEGNVLESPKEIAGHSISLQAMGTLMLWFGWYGFNPGSALLLNTENTGEVASLAAVNTTLSAASGAISALFAHAIFSTQATKELSLNLTKALNGSLAGLVAITAACGTVEPWAAALIGCIAGFVYLGASHFLVVLRLDDAVDGIPIHMFCGMWGLLATGLLSTPGGLEAAYGSDVHIGFLYSLGKAKPDATLLLNQFIAILFILGWTVGLMLPFFVALNRMGWLRADALEEIAGLDARYHHGVQENQEEIRQAIVQEYKRLKIPKSGKVAKGSRSNHSSSSNTPETMDDVSFQNFLNV